MLASAEALAPIYRCPRTGLPLHREDDALVAQDRRYPIIAGAPVLVDFDASLLDRDTVLRSGGGSPVERPRYRGAGGLIKRLLSPAKKSTRDNVARLIRLLDPGPAEPETRTPLVLVVGGGSVGQGMQDLYDHPRLRLAAFDIYHSPAAQFIADAHAIPLQGGAVDAVVIQAVLEHVLQPDQVVAEIWRVLRPGGLVYAETPFLQHVHEGAYDFTRYTESGHRYLFRRFALIASGTSGGAGTQLLWSIDYFARGLFRSRRAGKLFKLAFVWLRLFDRLIPESYASDAASGTYFLGRKADGAISPGEIVAFYRGAQRGSEAAGEAGAD